MGAYSIRELMLYVEDTTKPVVVIIIMTRGGTLLLKYSKATGETQPSGSMFKKTSGTDIAVPQTHPGSLPSLPLLWST